jgi:hypothetical protein
MNFHEFGKKTENWFALSVLVIASAMICRGFFYSFYAFGNLRADLIILAILGTNGSIIGYQTFYKDVSKGD